MMLAESLVNILGKEIAKDMLLQDFFYWILNTDFKTANELNAKQWPLLNLVLEDYKEKNTPSLREELEFSS